MFWTIVFILAWYNTGLLCTLFLSYLDHLDGEDFTVDSFKNILFMSLLGWIMIVVTIVYTVFVRNADDDQQKILFKGKERE